MKYLYSVVPEYIAEAERGNYAKADEAVIPWYPAPLQNMFLSIESFRKSIHAVVKDMAVVDVEAFLKRLWTQYPGLPEALHSNYIYHTAKAASLFPVGTRFRIYITPQSAAIHQIGGDETIHTLWTEQPLEVQHD